MSLAALWGLFLAAFAAATLLPAQSELALAGLLAAGHKPVWLFIAVATAGNTLGAAVNWLLGRYCTRFQNRSWFPVKKKSMDKAASWYRRYGRWSLLLSWAPSPGGGRGAALARIAEARSPETIKVPFPYGKGT